MCPAATVQRRGVPYSMGPYGSSVDGIRDSTEQRMMKIMNGSVEALKCGVWKKKQEGQKLTE